MTLKNLNISMVAIINNMNNNKNKMLINYFLNIFHNHLMIHSKFSSNMSPNNVLNVNFVFSEEYLLV